MAKKVVSFSIEKKQLNKINELSEEKDISKSKLFRKALHSYLKQSKDKEVKRLNEKISLQKSLINQLREENKRLNEEIETNKNEIDFEDLREEIKKRYDELSRYEKFVFMILSFFYRDNLKEEN